jgi:16S rRNA (uracil1498-N3)-methyltransferase
MARRRFFVDQFHSQRAELTGEDAHHLTRVLRVERGQKFEVSDNRQVWLAEVTEAHKERVVFSLLEEVPLRPAVARLTLLVSVVKFDRMEWIFEKGTELGVERFIPVIADRTEHGLEKAINKRRDRWEKILMESSQQCRRDRLPQLGDWLPFSDAVKMDGQVRWLLDEDGGTPIAKAAPTMRLPTDQVLVLIGPEGGWTARERAAGWTRVTLGNQILRTETAALAAAAIVDALWAT